MAICVVADWIGQNIPHFLSPLSPMNFDWGRREEGGLFPIDCLIAPEAACPGPRAKSVIFVAKVGLGRFPSLSPRFEEGNPESPERLEEPGVYWPLLFKGVLQRQGCWD